MKPKAEVLMTLRDYFASCASEEDIKEQIALGNTAAHGWQNYTRAQARYKHADSMLAERAKK